MQVIICEKPSQAKLFSQALSNGLQLDFKAHKGYYESATITVTHAIGHLFQLAPPELYNSSYKTWSLTNLPILPNQFKLISNPKTKAQLATVHNLLKKATRIYNATDAEREGELIFRYILQGLNITTPNDIRRIWTNDLEETTIVNAYKSAKDQSEYHNLYLSAKARSEADWLIGLNATRALSVAGGKNSVLSLGRVQTAVLKLIVKRHEGFLNFIKQDLFIPSISITSNTQVLDLKLNFNFKDKLKAESYLNDLPEQIYLNKKVEKKLIKQPKLYALSDLYIESSKTLNLSATQTLAVAQSLYEKGFISYPRTDSNYLTTNQITTVKTTLKHLINQNLDWFKTSLTTADILTNDNIENHFIFNNSKTSDHYAIIPLQFNLSKVKTTLTDPNEVAVLKLIVKRFFRTFMNKAIVESTTYNVENKPYSFIKRGQIVLSPGHLKIENDTQQSTLPNLEIGNYKDFKKDITKSETTPIRPYSESELISAMKNPLNHGNLDNEAHKTSIKSLGTPATMDSYLPLLIKRNYVTKVKKEIIPTALGTSIILQLATNKITSIKLTAEIEYTIGKIAKGEQSYEGFITAIKKYASELTKDIIDNSDAISKNVKTEDQAQHNCPKCKKGLIYKAKSGKNYYCSNYNHSTLKCDFILYSKIAGTTLSKSAFIDIISDKRITKALKFTSKANKPYSAKIKLNDEFKTELIFEN